MHGAGGVEGASWSLLPPLLGLLLCGKGTLCVGSPKGLQKKSDLIIKKRKRRIILISLGCFLKKMAKNKLEKAMIN